MLWWWSVNADTVPKENTATTATNITPTLLNTFTMTVVITTAAAAAAATAAVIIIIIIVIIIIIIIGNGGGGGDSGGTLVMIVVTLIIVLAHSIVVKWMKAWYGICSNIDLGWDVSPCKN